MAAKSDIEWTQATWNPIAGCSIVSAGYRECYAMRRVAPRLASNPATPHYAGTVEPSKAGYVWTGKIGIASDKVFLAPLRTRKPTTFFVNSVSDLFHEEVPDEVIDRIFAIMALCPQHTFQVLTKRPERMRAYMIHDDGFGRWGFIEHQARQIASIDPGRTLAHFGGSNLPNVWLGTSAEDQKTADARIPHLLATPAAIRFLSAEPLLGAIDLTDINGKVPEYGSAQAHGTDVLTPYNRILRPQLDWVIVGGESGRNARPMHPGWARQIRDQCAAAAVPFFFKQWGEWLPVNQMTDAECDRLYKPAPQRDPDATRRCNVAVAVLHRDGQQFGIDAPNVFLAGAGALCIYAVGKKAAGRLLDGVEHDGVPASGLPLTGGAEIRMPEARR